MSRRIHPGTARQQRPSERHVLAAIARAQEPVGARIAAQVLREQGFAVSASTVTRLLQSLDNQGLTRPAGSKGRLPTDRGRDLARAVAADQRRRVAMSQALDIRSVTDLIDLLHARRAVEREAARLAAQRATAAELEEIERWREEHEAGLPGDTPLLPGAIGIHRLIGRASHSRLLAAMTDDLFAPELENLNQVMDLISATSGTIGQSSVDHLRMITALRDRDAEAADSAIIAHLDRLIAEAEEFAAQDRAPLIDGIIRLSSSPGRAAVAE